MAFLGTMNIVGSGLTAEQLRLDVISENITNMQTTRTENGDGPYRRKTITFEAESGKNEFRMIMARLTGASNRGYEKAGGVRVVEIGEDMDAPFPVAYDPTHPDADEDGYLQMPNITLVKEITDAMAATQAYSANVTAFNTLKTVVSRGLEIGK